jgi:hypothetical protein
MTMTPNEEIREGEIGSLPVHCPGVNIAGKDFFLYSLMSKFFCDARVQLEIINLCR